VKDLSALSDFALRAGIDGGMYRLASPIDQKPLRIIASFGEGWDHVSVSRADRIPNWIEMCFVKKKFFDPEELAMQLHPAESEYINNHPRCLHLWKPHDAVIPTPPGIMVGIKGVDNVSKTTAKTLMALLSAAQPSPDEEQAEARCGELEKELAQAKNDRDALADQNEALRSAIEEMRRNPGGDYVDEFVDQVLALPAAPAFDLLNRRDANTLRDAAFAFASFENRKAIEVSAGGVNTCEWLLQRAAKLAKSYD
jgi:hypothetical protein